MKAYKGFKKNSDGTLNCRGFKYEEGKTYHEELVYLCHFGFHACELPIDVFSYYNSNMGEVEFHEVELEGVSAERLYDSKVCATDITIGRKITPEEMVEISIKMMLEDKEKYFGESDVALVRKDTKWNYINSEGRLLSETWFDYVYGFCNGFSKVEKEGKENFIDKDGKLVSEEWFESCCNFAFNGIALVRQNGNCRFIDTTGKTVSL